MPGWWPRAPRRSAGAIASLVNALDPDAVVIGGGLGLVERYREAAVAAARPLIWAEDVRGLPIVPGRARGRRGDPGSGARRADGGPEGASSRPERSSRSSRSTAILGRETPT